MIRFPRLAARPEHRIGLAKGQTRVARAHVRVSRRKGGREIEAGLTLIEVLVVLAIVGVMTGVTVLGAGLLDRGARAQGEAERLADRLRLAADEVLVTAAPLAMVHDAQGYRFLAWNAEAAEWRPSPQAALGPRHDLPAALRLEREGPEAAAPVIVTPDLPQPPVALIIVQSGAGAGAPWRVGFDGFAASAAPAGD